jgi:AhpD family alkylhydroperoxidase
MLSWLINRKITKAERELGVSLDYARWIAKASLPATLRMAKFTKLLHAHRGPATAVHVASIVGSMADDCGSCVQIGVNLARKAGVSREILEAVVRRAPETLPADLADVYRFAEAATLNAPELDDFRERVRDRYGDAGLIEIALAVAMHRVYPTLKRGLGFAKSCSLELVSKPT